MDKQSQIARLNRIFHLFLGEICLLDWSSEAPVLQQDQEHPTCFPAPADWPEPAINDLHALVKDVSYPCTQFLYQEIDYKGVLWLRQQKLLAHTPPAPQGGAFLLGAGALPYCRESAELLVQQRSVHTATFPGGLHVIGGATSPRRRDGQPLDRSLQETAIREMREEAGLSIVLPQQSRMVIAIEFTSGFFHSVFLQVPVTRPALDQMKTTWEGELLRVPFAQLDHLLLAEGAYHKLRWVPSGMMHLLSWLAWGDLDPQLRFGGKGQTAGELFATILEHLEYQLREQPEALRARFAPVTLSSSLALPFEDHQS
ncbi:NUDIX domain-containing protein [Candidatus Magnetaquicoccus inordinatus]|uniref:NUDIX domain-containing protein n=1 Tax=Candidatus Magnetaquicoccus inordinatus TaxID=2496818 RepID=UPI00102AC35F|nr:NUDIX domain-containing protein [Candidatus Magnetaquicoccus inordinatus]